MSNKDLVKSCFKALFEDPIYVPSVIDTYFSKDYIQCVDGKRFDYVMFNIHIQKVKELTKCISITFNHIVEEGSTVFTNHTVAVTMADGTISQVKVIATFIIRDNQIVFCDELTMHLDDHQKNKDLGSVV